MRAEAGRGEGEQRGEARRAAGTPTHITLINTKTRSTSTKWLLPIGRAPDANNAQEKERTLHSSAAASECFTEPREVVFFPQEEHRQTKD